MSSVKFNVEFVNWSGFHPMNDKKGYIVAIVDIAYGHEVTVNDGKANYTAP
jgi:hypothetical protein